MPNLSKMVQRDMLQSQANHLIRQMHELDIKIYESASLPDVKEKNKMREELKLVNAMLRELRGGSRTQRRNNPNQNQQKNNKNNKNKNKNKNKSRSRR